MQRLLARMGSSWPTKAQPRCLGMDPKTPERDRGPSRFATASWRRVLVGARVVFSLGLVAAVVWGIHGFLTAPLHGDHVFTPFSGTRPPPLQRTAPDGTTYTINLGEAIVALDMGSADATSRLVFPTYAAALRHARDARLPTMPSTSLVLAACRALDARLQSAVERHLERGERGRPALVQRWLATVLARRTATTGALRTAYDRAAQHLAGALAASGIAPVLPDDLAVPSAAVTDTPIGPWGEAADLSRIWHRDRILADRLQVDDDASAAVAAVLARSQVVDAELRDGWAGQAAVARAWTGPAGCAALEDLAAALSAFPDSELAGSAACGAVRACLEARPRPDRRRAVAPAAVAWSPTPEDLILQPLGMAAWDDPIGALIQAIDAGSIDLAPGPDAGFYRRRWHALETLAAPARAPETDKLQLSLDYRRRWQRAFAAGFSEGRSSLVKRLPSAALAGSYDGRGAPIEVAPEFTAEPSPVVYLRLARAYRALGTDLEQALGAEDWRSLRDERGTALADEVARRAQLLVGLAARVYLELGFAMPRNQDETVIDLDAAMRAAVAWAGAADADPDVAADARLLVTLADGEDGRQRCPAIIGVRLEPVIYSWVEKPEVHDGHDARFVDARAWLPSPCTLVTTVETVPTPAAFRARCDGHAEADDLYAAFGGRPPALRQPQAVWWPWILALGALTACLVGLGLSWRSLRRRGHRWMGPVAACSLLGAGIWIAVAPPYLLVYATTTAAMASNNNLAVLLYGWVKHCDEAVERRLYLDQIRHPDPQVRYLASFLVRLVETDGFTPEQLAVLRSVRDDPVPEVAEVAWYFRCRSPEPIRELLADLERPTDPDRLLAMLWAMQRHHGKDPEFHAAVMRLMQSPRDEQRAVAYRSCVSWEELPADYIIQARTALADPYPAVRRAATVVMRQRGTGEDVPRLLPLLCDTATEVRCAAFASLGRLLTPSPPAGADASASDMPDWSAPATQEALAAYAGDPAMTAAERISASRLITDRSRRIATYRSLLPVVRGLPHYRYKYLRSQPKTYVATWTCEQALACMVEDWLVPAPSPPAADDSAMVPGRQDVGTTLHQQPVIFTALVEALVRSEDPRSALPILRAVPTDSPCHATAISLAQGIELAPAPAPAP